MEYRLASLPPIHAVKLQAMQMDVEIGRRAEALDERDRTGVGLAAFESRLFDQKCGNDPVSFSASARAA